MTNLPTGVEKHAQAILDRHGKHTFLGNEGTNHYYCGQCDSEWPCPDAAAAEAVLVAAREHDTRQARAIQHIENIVVRGYCPTKDDDRADAVAALRLLRPNKETD